MDLPDVAPNKSARRIFSAVAGYAVTLGGGIFFLTTETWWSLGVIWVLLSFAWVYILWRVAKLIHLEGQIYALDDMAQNFPGTWPWWPDG